MKREPKKEKVLDKISRYIKPNCFGVNFEMISPRCHDCAYWGDCWWLHEQKN